MKHVPVAIFKDRVSQYIAEVEAGNEILITRHGKPAVKLIAAESDRQKSQQEAVNALWALGQKIRTDQGPTPVDDMIGWVREDRR